MVLICANGNRIQSSFKIEFSNQKMTMHSNYLCKALGILWHPQNDNFTFRLSLDKIKLPLTKRKLVSEIAKLFDPLGWLSPSIILGKLMIQQLWLNSYEWDQPLPIELQEYWLKMRHLLFECDQIKIPRWVGIKKTSQSYSLHGFADASERAFAAVVYLRTEHENGSVQVNLISAKSKVAPLQQTTLPRLELCGALLLAKLLVKIIKALEMTTVPVHAYSDSMIAIEWINGMPIRWQTFVANRVSEIQELLPATKWKHIISQLNPADCATRGMFVNELKTFDMWWSGPEFLKSPPTQWPTTTSSNLPKENIPEQRKSTKILKVFHSREDNENDLLHRYSNLSNLLRITAYVLRWKTYKRTMKSSTENSVLSVGEIDIALKHWVRIIQQQYFPDEWKKLKVGSEIKSSSSILALTPTYSKSEQILRSSSRLKNSDLSIETIRPIILPSKGYFTWLIINDAHQRTIHGGCQITLQLIRQRYWILHGRTTVSAQLNKCVRGFRYKLKTRTQLMGDLPDHRVRIAHTFQHTGIDFAGYFEVKTSCRRNAPFIKCYVALFVCMVTKAIHLELVRDLTTEAFLDAFRCFSARRGLPNEIYTDRGSNFIGARVEMPNLLFDLKSQQSQFVVNELLNDNITWHFNPANSPHFGGLWEAGVKSMKNHLKRVLHQTKMTEHQFHSTIIQIEACLNSVPIKKDGLVRAVELKCKKTIITRSIHTLCLLPTEDNSELFKQMLKPGQHVGTNSNFTD